MGASQRGEGAHPAVQVCGAVECHPLLQSALEIHRGILVHQERHGHEARVSLLRSPDDDGGAPARPQAEGPRQLHHGLHADSHREWKGVHEDQLLHDA